MTAETNELSLELNTKEVNIFDFHDYRLYLKAIYEKLKVTKMHFSYRYFAKLAGFGGQSYLRMVIDGQRNLSPTSISKCAFALKLSRKEMAYFEAMVLYNQAKNEADRERYFSQLRTLRPKTQIKGLTQDQFEYLTHHHFVIIREMAALPDFQGEPEWIAQHLAKKIKLGEIKHALEVLERLELLKRNEEGKLIHSGKTLQTPVDADSLEIFNFHRQVLIDSRDAMLTAPEHEWDVASMTVPVPKTSLPKLMDLLQRCREDIAHLINEGSTDYHEVFQINMQLFPVTKTKHKSGPSND